MRRTDRFVISHGLYAADLSSLERPDRESSYVQVRAVWFRLRRGVLAACIGHLWNHQTPMPATAVEFLEQHTDGRYGGSCEGRWDSRYYWGHPDPEVMRTHIDVLQPMLDNYPAVPGGYDGWWTFRPETGHP